MGKKADTIGVIIVLILITFFGLRYFLARNSLKNEFKYTIGFVYSHSSGGRSGPKAEFYYFVNEKRYDGLQFLDQSDKSIINDRFYVKYSPSNPRNNELIISERVPSYIKDAPPEGWKEIPRYLGRQPEKQL